MRYVIAAQVRKEIRANLRRGMPRWCSRDVAKSIFSVLFIICGIGHSQAADPALPKIVSPSKAVKILSANCTSLCWLSGLFAPDVTQKNAATVVLRNADATKITLTPRFLPTNGLARVLGEGSQARGPAGQASAPRLGLVLPAQLDIEPGQTIGIPLLAPRHLSAGAYTGELIFADGNGRDVLDIPMEIDVRASVVWALAVALFGIVFGRISQLVYDPKVVARLQLLDWLNDIERALANVQDATRREGFQGELNELRWMLAARLGDAALLQPKVKDLDGRVRVARLGAGQQAGPGLSPAFAGAAGWATRSLRQLAGVSPIPLQQTYDWLLPVSVLLTIAILTIVFVYQQYGGSAETFGSGGLAQYVPLFLAGFASESIAGGLKTLRLK